MILPFQQSKPPGVGFLLVVLSGSLLLGSCTQSDTLGRRYQTIVATDSPWVPAAIQAYNRTNPEIPVQVHFSQNLKQDLENDTIRIDGVISQNLNYPQAQSLFADLTGILSDLGSPARYFLQDSLSYSSSEGFPLALPLAYDLPVAVFLHTPSTSPVPLEGQSIFETWSFEIEDFRSRSQSFSVRTDDRYTRLGYYPGWDREFLLCLSRLSGANFMADPTIEARLSWDSPGLNQVLEKVRTWQGDGGPNPDQIEEFNRRFAYAPWYRQILDNRVAYRVVRLSEFLALPSEYRSRLQFRWITADGRVPVAENPVYFFLSHNAESTLGVSNFVRWLVSPEGVSQVLETWIDNGQIGIQFLGGIPIDLRDPVQPREETSWEKVYYQGIELPPNARLSFPPTAPAQWESIIEEVILPWLREEMRNSQETGSPDNRLTKALEGWQKLYRQE